LTEFCILDIIKIGGSVAMISAFSLRVVIEDWIILMFLLSEILSIEYFNHRL